jgi:hypothetical protein
MPVKLAHTPAVMLAALLAVACDWAAAYRADWRARHWLGHGDIRWPVVMTTRVAAARIAVATNDDHL